MKVKLFILFVISSTVCALAQKGTIKGRVFNSKTNSPLEFASIRIDGTTIASTSDLDGNFIFTGIEPGFVKVSVQLLGYTKTLSPEIQVQGNQTVFVDIPVNEAPTNIKEVTVRANLNFKRIESPLSLLSVGVQEIEKTAGANRDISKVIQTLPGVALTDPNRSDLIVRGGGPSENVFYLDGIEIPVINHFTTQGSSGGSVGVINPDFVREINFYTGAFQANRPNALSSVMEIKQKDGSKDRMHTKFSVGASDAALTLDGPIGKSTTFIVSARQSYLQFLFKAIGLPFLPTYNDFQIKLKHRIDQKNEISFIGIGAIDNMSLNTDLKKNGTEAQKYLLSYLPVYKQWNYTLGVVYKHFDDDYVDNWVLSRNMLRNSNFKYVDDNELLGKKMDYLSDEAENKLRYERTFTQLPYKIQLGAGVKYAHYTNETMRMFYVNQNVAQLRYATKLNLAGYSVFGQFSDEYLDDLLKVSAGVSFSGLDYNKNMRNLLNQFSPRLSVSYALSDQVDINANVGRYFGQPAYTTLGFRDSTQGKLVNQNENLKFTTSNQAVVGVEYKPKNSIRLTLEAFYKQYSNYPVSISDGISTASKGTTFGQIGDERIVSSGKGRAFGVELLSKIIDWNRLNLTATYTLFRSEFSGLDGVYRPSSWDTKQLLNLIASYRASKSWYFAARWHYSGGAPYTPINQELSSLKKAWDVTNQPYLDYSQFNSLRLKGSHQLDVRIDKEFYFKKWLMNLYADVQNVYNYKSQSTPVYTVSDPVSGLPVTDPANPDKYVLRTLDVFGGTILPTVGLIFKL